MATKFQKNHVYLVKIKRLWYVVAQTGARSWDAMEVGHVWVVYDQRLLHGNSQSLWDDMNAMADKAGETMVAHRYDATNAGLPMYRRALMSVLKYGRTDGEV